MVDRHYIDVVVASPAKGRRTGLATHLNKTKWRGNSDLEHPHLSHAEASDLACGLALEPSSPVRRNRAVNRDLHARSGTNGVTDASTKYRVARQCVHDASPAHHQIG